MPLKNRIGSTTLAAMTTPRLARFAPLAAALCAIGLALAAGMQIAAAREPSPTERVKPGAKSRSVPYVSITRDDGSVKYYETNAIPLLWNKACFGWRMHVGGPNRFVSMVEILNLSAPAKKMIHGPETVVENNQRAITRARELVEDGFIQRAWCILEGDPPGVYRYDITIDGEPRGEFVFCAIEMPTQDDAIDPRDLVCPNKFHSVGRAAPRLAAAEPAR